MALVLTRVHADDYDAWKKDFDSDPYGARAAAKGHRVARSVDEPSELYVQVEFGSVEDAKAARERLISGGLLERANVTVGPTVVELADAVQY